MRSLENQLRCAVLVVGGASLALWSQSVGQTRGGSQATHTDGAKLFAASCAGCHGLDGRGGERAPNIAQNHEVQRLADAQLMHVIEEGISGTGMPAFHSLRTSEIKAIVAYLRLLQGGGDKMPRLPGDPERGQQAFVKVGCSDCHMVAGSGGFLASDLSSYGSTHAGDEIRSAITAPNQAAEARSVTLRTHDGQSYSGRIRNEDNFSLQLQGLDGTFYFLTKSDVEEIAYSPRSLMPSDYNTRLSPQDLNDIISYLIKSASDRGSDESSKHEHED
ncbi:MAG TPA: c-type cytochrome [Terriglobales bacterium]|nr:c-type cytochrome [Terriglobales bacterium]